MLKRIAVILINYKNYAEEFLPTCWAGLIKQDYAGEKKVFIVDNESSAESLALLKRVAPSAEIVINKDNDGFAKGNNDAIKLACRQKFDYIILFNMDAEAAGDCFSKLVAAAESEKEIGAAQARLMMFSDKNKINSLGNVTHFLGFGYSEGNGQAYRETAGGSEPLATKAICYPSGAAVLFKAEVLEKAGLFDEKFWMYNEDQDLGWRIWLAGYKCVLAPDALAYHKYEFKRSIKKYYYLDRNRIMAMLNNYHWATLILIFPAFLAMEIGLIFFSIKGGWFKEKLKVYAYFLSLKNWLGIFASRRRAQDLRKIKDKEIIKFFSGRIWYQEIGEWRLRIANLFFNAYWRIIKVFIWW